MQQFFTTVDGGMYAQYASALEGFNGAGLGKLREEHFLRRCPEMGDAMYGAWQEKLSLAQYKPTAGYRTFPLVLHTHPRATTHPQILPSLLHRARRDAAGFHVQLAGPR